MKLTEPTPPSPLHRAPSVGATPSEFYRAEAARLREMGTSSSYHDVREGLLCIAREYDLLADQRAGLLHHRFGEPLRRPVIDDGYPCRDDRQNKLD